MLFFYNGSSPGKEPFMPLPALEPLPFFSTALKNALALCNTFVQE